MNNSNQLRQVVDDLFGLFEQGEWEAAAKLFSKDAQIIGQYGKETSVMTVNEFVQKAKHGPLSKLGKPVYLKRRVVILGTDGFIEQHISQLSINEQVIELPVCLVGKFDETGAITLLEEYLDPAPVTSAFMKQKKEKPILHEGPPPNNLHVIITGASSGIGENIAYRYATTGCKIVLCARRKGELNRVAAQCKALNPLCEPLIVVTDISKREDCEKLVKQAVKTFGIIDRLYLNAGASQSATLMEIRGTRVIREIMETNFFGAADTVEMALPHLNSTAKIGVISSVLGKVAAPFQTGYVGSKAALHGFFNSLRMELEATQSISIICPGPVRTGILTNLKGPKNAKVGFNLSEQQLEQLMSPAKAARLAVQNCESNIREYIFGEDLSQLVKLYNKAPEQAEAILSKMYRRMHKNQVIIDD